jgi:leader peptidase (prepilin peptidase)/N-methyltransferase
MATEAAWPAIVLIPALAAASATDLRARVVPDRLNIAAAVAALALGLAFDPGSVPGRLACAMAAGGSLGALALLRPGGMGLGDAKLAAVMGLCLGAAVAVALLIAFGLGALAGLILLGREGRVALRHGIPFAPYLAAGGLAALLVGDRLLAAYVAAL